MFTPDQFPKLMLLSALSSSAVGVIVGQASDRWDIALASAILLFVVDWIGIRKLMK